MASLSPFFFLYKINCREKSRTIKSLIQASVESHSSPPSWIVCKYAGIHSRDENAWEKNLSLPQRILVPAAASFAFLSRSLATF